MSRQITRISPVLSSGVQAEAEAFADMSKELAKFARTESATQYWQTGTSLAPYQYESLFAGLRPGSRVLDVGVGFGQSSVYLADKGHRVVAVEPAMVLCELVRDAAERHSLDLEVIQGVGEDLSAIGRQDFDVVVFNSSLHHCDDPLKAIGEARKCLAPGGAVYLVNENMLKPWQTQAGFLRKLEEDPQAMGHYGGNEHSYHNWYYADLLRKHFRSVDLVVPRAGTALDDLRAILAHHIEGVPVHNRNLPVLTRFMFYLVREKVRHVRWLYLLLARVSLVPVHFRGANPL